MLEKCVAIKYERFNITGQSMIDEIICDNDLFEQVLKSLLETGYHVLSVVEIVKN